MKLNPPRRDWFFPIGEAPVLATVIRNDRTVRVTIDLFLVGVPDPRRPLYDAWMWRITEYELPELPETKGIRVIADLAAAQLNDAIKAFCDGDLKLALVLQSRDDALDAAYRAFHQEVIGIMEKDSSHVRNDVDLLFITRFLERIGDQSVNIAEDAVYLMTNYDIRHGGELPPQ